MNPNIKRPRDNQQSKVIATLESINKTIPPCAKLSDLQKLATRLNSSLWLKKRSTNLNPYYSVCFSFNQTAFCYAGNYCKLVSTHRTVLDLLHQMTHYVLPNDVAWHGPEFASMLLELVEHVGLETLNPGTVIRRKQASTLREEFKYNKVKFCAKNKLKTIKKPLPPLDELTKSLQELHNELRNELQ